MEEGNAMCRRILQKADPMVLQSLKEKGLLLSAPVFEHSYPHCWRCDTPPDLLCQRILVHPDDGGEGGSDPQ